MRDVVVISLSDEGTYGPRIRKLGVPVEALKMRRGWPRASDFWRLRQLVKRYRPDLVQGWMYHGNLVASLAATMVSGRRPTLAWNIRHSLYSLSAEKFLTRQVIRANCWFSSSPNAILYNSCLSRNQHESFGFSVHSGHVIPNGFDVERLRPDPKCGQLIRRSLEIPANAFVIGHVARFHPIKNHASFLQAAVRVMKQKPDVVCLLAGRNVDLINPALSGIVPPELKARFRFLGEREDVPDLMQAMNLFCQSSWSEAFPNVLGEAMALGVPCLATDVGDSRAIIGDTGFVVPPLNSRLLAEGLLTVLDKPRLELASLGRAARIRVESNYALPKVVEQYRALYERITTR